MKISIITPVYNGVATIERTIKSVLEQKYADIEYIIVDGLSSDGTEKIIKQYSDNITKYIREKDDGIYDAINKGIREATGDIIGIINSDDWYEPKCLEEVSAFFDNSDTDIVYGDFNLINQNTVEKRSAGELKRICMEMTIPHPTMFVRRHVYELFGLYNTEYSIAADYDFILRCYIKGLKFGHIPSVLANFSLGGISSTKPSLCKEETQTIMKKYIDDSVLRECFSEMLDKKLVVHGAGFWGKWLVEKLVSLYTNDIVWIDKNCRSENEISIFGIKLLPLSECNSNRQIVVAIYCGDEVERSYLESGNSVLGIRALLNRYMDKIASLREKQHSGDN